MLITKFMPAGGFFLKRKNGKGMCFSPAPTEGRTLYFNNDADNDWNNLGNWWLDAGFTVPALALPEDGDSVETYGTISTPPSESVSLASLVVAGNTGSHAVDLTGITAPTTFTEGATLLGSLIGNAIFEEASSNYGDVTGNVIFRTGSSNVGTVTGPADVYYPAEYPLGGTVTGITSYHGFVLGCTNPLYEEYNPEANTDDGSCLIPVPIRGCTDPSALNYNPEATEDDGSCAYP